MGERSGRTKEVLGWATGDREVEAEGRVEEDPAATVTDEAVDDEEKDVRRDYRGVRPERPPAGVDPRRRVTPSQGHS